MNWIDLFAKEKGIDLIKYVSVSELSEHENRGLPNAILLVKILPKDYIGKLARAKKADCSVFTQTEHFTDEIADLLAEEIRKKAYQAISQSENSLLNRGDFLPEIKTSILPHKKIATLSGIGWIGKNNLLVTKEYGCALSMCTVLTDMPVKAEKSNIMMPQCGDCSLCAKICPPQVIFGATWSFETHRDHIVDVYHCETCLKCLAKCRYSQKYANT